MRSIPTSGDAFVVITRFVTSGVTVVSRGAAGSSSGVQPSSSASTAIRSKRFATLATAPLPWARGSGLGCMAAFSSYFRLCAS